MKKLPFSIQAARKQLCTLPDSSVIYCGTLLENVTSFRNMKKITANNTTSAVSTGSSSREIALGAGLGVLLGHQCWRSWRGRYLSVVRDSERGIDTL